MSQILVIIAGLALAMIVLSAFKIGRLWSTPYNSIRVTSWALFATICAVILWVSAKILLPIYCIWFWATGPGQ